MAEQLSSSCGITGPLMQPLPRDEAAQKAVDGGLKPLSQLILEVRLDPCLCEKVDNADAK